MLRTRVTLSALCLALTAPVLANQQAVPKSRSQSAELPAAASVLSTSAWECSAPDVTVPFNEEYYWLLTAYRELDCAIEAVERVMKKSADSEEGTVTLSREELEYLRARAFSAKDAAARIGR
jgi:hypothetical protein